MPQSKGVQSPRNESITHWNTLTKWWFNKGWSCLSEICSVYLETIQCGSSVHLDRIFGQRIGFLGKESDFNQEQCNFLSAIYGYLRLVHLPNHGRRAISLTTSWCPLGLSLGEVSSISATCLCATLRTHEKHWRSGWYSEMKGFVEGSPFCPFPSILGRMVPTSDYEWDCIQNSFTTSPDKQKGNDILGLSWAGDGTSGSGQYPPILVKRLAPQPREDFDRGWSTSPRGSRRCHGIPSETVGTENHPPCAAIANGQGGNPHLLGEQKGGETLPLGDPRDTEFDARPAEFGHFSSPIPVSCIKTLTRQMLGLPVLRSFLFALPCYNSCWTIGFWIIEAIDWTISRHFTCICSSFWKRCWNLKPGNMQLAFGKQRKKKKQTLSGWGAVLGIRCLVKSWSSTFHEHTPNWRAKKTSLENARKRHQSSVVPKGPNKVGPIPFFHFWGKYVVAMFDQVLPVSF